MSNARTIVTTGTALLLMAASPVQIGFGSRVVPVAGQSAPFATADLDGDGVPDSIYVVSVSSGSTLPPDVTVVSGLWSSTWRASSSTKRALAIVVGKPQRKFLIADPDYFDTPIWSEKQLPLAVAKRGTKPFREFQVQEKRIQHDILVLGTEAGIDTTLYWNGKTFALFEPIEEP
jgi:hypothetical protein